MAQAERSLMMGESTGHFVETLAALVMRELGCATRDRFSGRVGALEPARHGDHPAVRVHADPEASRFPFLHLHLQRDAAMGLVSASLQSGATTLIGQPRLVRTPFFSEAAAAVRGHVHELSAVPARAPGAARLIV